MEGNQVMFWHPGMRAQCTGSILWGHLVPSKARVEFYNRSPEQLCDSETFKHSELVVSETAGSVFHSDEQPRRHSELPR